MKSWMGSKGDTESSSSIGGKRESRYPYLVATWSPVALNVMYLGQIGHFYFQLDEVANISRCSPINFDVVSCNSCLIFVAVF